MEKKRHPTLDSTDDLGIAVAASMHGCIYSQHLERVFLVFGFPLSDLKYVRRHILRLFGTCKLN